jgi:hypothetical protein
MLGRVLKRGDIWWVAFSCKGKEYRRSAKSLRKSDAQILLRKYLGQVADGTFTGFHEDHLFVHELLDDHLEDFIQRGGRSADQLRSHIKPLRERFNSVKATNLTERQIDLYIKHRLELRKSRTTINREMQALGQAFWLAAKKKLIDHIPHIPKFREHNARQGFSRKTSLSG